MDPTCLPDSWNLKNKEMFRIGLVGFSSFDIFEMFDIFIFNFNLWPLLYLALFKILWNYWPFILLFIFLFITTFLTFLFYFFKMHNIFKNCWVEVLVYWKKKKKKICTQETLPAGQPENIASQLCARRLPTTQLTLTMLD